MLTCRTILPMRLMIMRFPTTRLQNRPMEDLKEYFRRLQFGLTLTAKRATPNAVHSNLTNFARRLSRHDFFKRKVWIR